MINWDNYIFPDEWRKVPVKYLLDYDGIKIGPFGSSLKLETLVEEGIKIYGQGNVIKNDFSLGHRHLKPEDFEREFKQYEIIPGDVLVTMMGTTGKSKVFQSGYERGILDSHLLRLRFCSTKLLPELFSILLEHSDYVFHQIKMSSKGSIMEGLNSTIIKNLILLIPPLKEQKIIVGYLEKKTQQIDSLIEKIQKKIELLKEQRTSLINQCVTKGLDPNVEMKDSGVEWIGEIPKHWELKKLTHICTRTRNGFVGPTRDIMRESGVKYIQGIHTSNTGELKFTPDGPFYVSPEWSKEHNETVIYTDDLLVVQTGTIGNIGYVTPEFNQSNCHQLIIVTTDKSVCLGRYLMYQFLGSYVQNVLQSIKTGEILYHINPTKLRFLKVLVPTIDEQERINSFLDEKTRQIDKLISLETSRLNLIIESRQSIISSVVTGKIRVTEDMI